MTVSVLPVRPIENADAGLTTLRIGMIEPIDSMNPFIGVNDNAYIFYGLVYDFLICVDEDLHATPNLALSWWKVPDAVPYGSVWQYNLTHNAYWHDGEPFDADDVVFTVNYQIGLNWTDMWAYQPYTVLVDSVQKVDRYTVRLHFRDFDRNPAPASYGDAMMLPIVPEHYWRNVLPSAAGFSHTNPRPLGTGPFMCTDQTYDEFLTGDRLVLYKNPDYHGVRDYGWEVKFDRLILEFYLEPSSLVTDIQRGAIDLAELSPPHFKNLVDWLSNNPTPSIGTHNGLKPTQFSKEIGICMNNKSGAATNLLRLDSAVRKAMAYATNKSFICDVIFKGYAEKGSALLSPIAPSWYWEPSAAEEYSFSLAKANQILDEAGYVWNSDHTVRLAGPENNFTWLGERYSMSGKPLSFEVVVEAELYEDLETYQYLREEWAKVGIKLTSRVVNSALWGVLVYGGYFDLTITYWSGDPDPNYLLYVQSTYSVNGWSENWYSSPFYDENYTQSLLEVDQEIRRGYVKNCQYWDYVDAAFIVYCYPHGCHAWRNDHFSGWGNWTAHPGRSLANFWSANPLFFELTPLTGNEAPQAILDNVAGPAGQALTITAFARDPDGDEMTYWLDFGDETNASGEVPANGEIELSHAFAAPGEYQMALIVYDASSADTEGQSAVIVGPGGNAPVSNLRVMPTSFENLHPDRSIDFRLTGKDLEDDPVTMTLDFGDGAAPFETEVADTAGGFEEGAAHMYAYAEASRLVLSAHDGHNWTNVTFTLVLTEEEKGLPVTLIAVALGAVAVVAMVGVLLMRRRRGAKEEEEVRLP